MRSPFSDKFWRRVRSGLEKLDNKNKPAERRTPPEQIRVQAVADRAWAAARNRYDEILAASKMPFNPDDPHQAAAKMCLCLVAGEINLREGIIAVEGSE